MVYDVLGNPYPTEEIMCEIWEVPYYLYKRRLKWGWSPSEALSGDSPTGKYIADHKGDTYDTVEDLCNAYNITKEILSRRLQTGMSLEKALTEPVIPVSEMPAVDHLGNTFQSHKAMYEFWGTTEDIAKIRLLKGDSLCTVLTTDRYGNSVEDSSGNRFINFTGMCNYHGADRYIFQGRLLIGESTYDALNQTEEDKVAYHSFTNIFDIKHTRKGIVICGVKSNHRQDAEYDIPYYVADMKVYLGLDKDGVPYIRDILLYSGWTEKDVSEIASMRYDI